VGKYIVQTTEGAIIHPVIAGVVLRDNGKYLLVQENQPNTQTHGLWNFPAGKVDLGDTLEHTAIKEVKEEVGVEVELIKKIGIFQDSADTPPKHAFEGKILAGEIKFPEEIMAAQWFSFKELQAMEEQLRGEWVLGAISILEENI
jgi:8-oxo-dGTP pyrophosphatase MutT (NUDIX family)